MSAGEDYPCGGRLLLFEVTRDEGAAPGQEKWKLVKKYVRCAERWVGCPVTVLHEAIAVTASRTWLRCNSEVAVCCATLAGRESCLWTMFAPLMSGLARAASRGHVRPVTDVLSMQRAVGTGHRDCRAGGPAGRGRRQISGSARVGELVGCPQEQPRPCIAVGCFWNGNVHLVGCLVVMSCSVWQTEVRTLHPMPQDGTRLRRRAFHDAPFLTTSLKVIKSFILNADVHRGPQFLRFKVRRQNRSL